MYVLSNVVRAFFMTLSSKLIITTTQTMFSKIFYLVSSTQLYSKHLKLDDRRSLSRFGGVIRPVLQFTAQSVFYSAAFYRLVYEILNL